MIPACPAAGDGGVADNVLFHVVPDDAFACTLPGEAWLGFVVEVSIVFSPLALLLAWIALRTKALVRRVAITGAASLAFLLAFIGSVYAESGCFVACAINVGLCYACSVACGLQCMLLIFEPLYVHNHIAHVHGAVRRLRAQTWGLFSLSACGLAVSAAIMAAFARDDAGVATYNAAVLSLLVCLWSSLLLTSLFIVVQAEQLKRVLTRNPVEASSDSKDGSPQHRSRVLRPVSSASGQPMQQQQAQAQHSSPSKARLALVPRLQLIRQVSLWTTASFGSLLIVLLPVFFVFHMRFPYYWAVVIAQVNLLIPVYAGLAIFLWPSVLRKTSSKLTMGQHSRSETAPTPNDGTRVGGTTADKESDAVAAVSL